MDFYRKLLMLASIFSASVLLSSCIEDEGDIWIGDRFSSQSNFQPVIINRSDLESSVKVIENKELQDAGKIYSYGNYILINEKYEGVHIFNNSDPRNPSKIGFIQIPGCVDMAVKDFILYADNAVDLVAIDISNYPDIVITQRVPKVFPELTAPDLGIVPTQFSEGQRPENTVIVKWERL